MAAEDEGNFFSRWSRRKVQVRTGQPLPADPVVVAPATVAKPAATSSSPPIQAVSPAGAASAANPGKDAAQPAAEAPSPLTLDDVAQLTPDGDFKPFMARQVAPEVRNAAVKKLFSDPHFNIMDGLDIYIDDYSKPSPLSAADMAGMVSAQFLKLVDDPNEPKPAAAAPSGVSDTDTATPQAPAEAEHHAEPEAKPEALAEAPPHNLPDPASAEEPPEPHDDHADLQLQPDHAPERQCPGRGAG